MEMEVEVSYIMVQGDLPLLYLMKKICRNAIKATRLRFCRAPADYM